MTDNIPHSGFFVLEPKMGATGRFAHDKSLRNASEEEIDFYKYGGFAAEITMRNRMFEPRQVHGQRRGQFFIFKYPKKAK